MFEKLKKAPSVQSYKRMWPFVKPHWFKALLAILITIPIGSLDAVIALSLKPYMDLVVVDKSIQSPYYIPVLIILFTLVQIWNFLASASFVLSHHYSDMEYFCHKHTTEDPIY